MCNVLSKLPTPEQDHRDRDFTGPIDRQATNLEGPG